MACAQRGNRRTRVSPQITRRNVFGGAGSLIRAIARERRKTQIERRRIREGREYIGISRKRRYREATDKEKVTTRFRLEELKSFL